MNTITSGSPAQTWRDFADQLPPHVIRRFERHELLTELHGPLAFPQEDPADVIRRDKEMMLAEARAQVPFAHVPLPDIATGADLWEDDSTGVWSRVVDGPMRTTGPLSVQISGVQSADGSVSWSASANTKDDAVSPECLRAFAVLLMETATELEHLNS